MTSHMLSGEESRNLIGFTCLSGVPQTIQHVYATHKKPGFFLARTIEI